MSVPRTLSKACQSPVTVRVRDFHPETHDTFTLTLVPPDGDDFRFQPGQFNMIYAFGVGEAAISLSGNPAYNASIVHTIRSVGSVTSALAKLRSGGSVGLRGPFGSAWPLDAARGQDVVIVSGGIGLAPLRPLILHILEHRAEFNRLILLHGVRSPADHLFADDLQQWARASDVQVLIAATKADRAWPGHVGVVTSLFEAIDIQPQQTFGFICGPEVMIRFALWEFRKARRRQQPPLHFPGAEHAVRRRFLRPLPVRPQLRLHGRSGLPLRPYPNIPRRERGLTHGTQAATRRIQVRIVRWLPTQSARL